MRKHLNGEHRAGRIGIDWGFTIDGVITNNCVHLWEGGLYGTH